MAHKHNPEPYHILKHLIPWPTSFHLSHYSISLLPSQQSFSSCLCVLSLFPYFSIHSSTYSSEVHICWFTNMNQASHRWYFPVTYKVTSPADMCLAQIDLSAALDTGDHSSLPWTFSALGFQTQQCCGFLSCLPGCSLSASFFITLPISKCWSV